MEDTRTSAKSGEMSEGMSLIERWTLMREVIITSVEMGLFLVRLQEAGRRFLVVVNTATEDGFLSEAR